MRPKIDYAYLAPDSPRCTGQSQLESFIAFAFYHIPPSYHFSFFTKLSPNITSPFPLLENPVNMAVAPVLKFLTVPAAAKHTATVIFVHVSLPGFILPRSLRYSNILLVLVDIFLVFRDWAIREMAGNLLPICSEQTPLSLT